MFVLPRTWVNRAQCTSQGEGTQSCTTSDDLPCNVFLLDPEDSVLLPKLVVHEVRATCWASR